MELTDAALRLCTTAAVVLTVADGPPGTVALHTPITFPDGDGVPVYLQRSADGWELTDLGSLAMRWWGDRAAAPALCARWGLTLRAGALTAPVDPADGGAVYQFAAALLVVDALHTKED